MLIIYNAAWTLKWKTDFRLPKPRSVRVTQLSITSAGGVSTTRMHNNDDNNIRRWRINNAYAQQRWQRLWWIFLETKFYKNQILVDYV